MAERGMNEIKELTEEFAQLKARWEALQAQAQKHKLWEKVHLITNFVRDYHYYVVEHEYDEKTHNSIHKYGKLKVMDRFQNIKVYHKDELVLQFSEDGELKKYRPGTWERTLNGLYRKTLETKLEEDIRQMRQHL